MVTVDTMVWIQRFAIETGRASEYVELYQLLGDEVRVEPVSPDLLVAEECADCLLADCERYVVLYTRPADVRKSDGT
jgi:hypothetical protein